MTEAPLRKCPKCGKPKLRRVFGAGAAIIFKGSGFYQTDYRSESYKAAAKAESESAKPAEKSATTPATGTTGNGSASKSAKKTRKSST